METQNKRIAKNTGLLYFRMLFTMVITLYTSRVILNVLGVEDFGIYNVVAGVITMLGFLNGSMTTATSRYITYDLGRGDKKELNNTFNTSLQIHILLSVMIFVLAEILGIWFVEHKLNIPKSRLFDAHIIFQMTVLNSILNIITVPYNSLIIAHEKMTIYAYISVIDVCMKLAIVFVLYFFDSHRLIIYGLLLLLNQFSQNIIYQAYSKSHFDESKIVFCFDKSKIKEMIGFAGWTIFTSLSAVCTTQGLNILLNLFFGPVVNASRGIAVQIQGAMTRFIQSVQIAFNPQITKSYANQNLDYLYELIVRSSRYSFFLMILLSVGLICETPFIIRLWLGTVPNYIIEFARLMLCITIVDTLTNPLGTALLATGDVKKYQFSIGVIMLTVIPCSYYLLKIGYYPSIVFIVQLFFSLISLIARLYLANKQIGISYSYYFKECILNILLTLSIIAVTIYLYYNFFKSNGFFNIVVVESCCFVVITFWGVTRKERCAILEVAKKKFKLKYNQEQ